MTHPLQRQATQQCQMLENSMRISLGTFHIVHHIAHQQPDKDDKNSVLSG